MTSPAITLFSDFNARALEFAPPRKNAKGGQFVSVQSIGPNNTRQNVILQTPVVTLPFDVNEYKNGSGVIESYNITVSLKDQDVFLQRMQAVDAALVEAAKANAKDWWPKDPKKPETLEDIMRKLVIPPPPAKPQYGPIMKVKVPVYNGVVDTNTKFYDADGKPIDISGVGRGCTARMLLELSPVWFVNKTSFGVTWKLRQLQVLSRPGLDECAFLPEAVPKAE